MSSSDQQPELPYVQAQAFCQQLQIELRQDGKSAELAAKLALVQPVFQQCFAALTETESAQSQPIQVEINKQLRLLEADSRFLSAARQPQIIQQRKQQVQQRLDFLTRYAAAIVELQAASETSPPD
jgi:hypothetical protein